MQEHVLILDFGSQYTQLIARRVRELNIYCEIHPYHKLPKDLEKFKAVILSGSPFSVLNRDSPDPDLNNILGEKPLLGICFGAQYLAHRQGGNVSPSDTREYGRAHLSYIREGERLFHQLSRDTQVWMSHSDTIQQLPTGAILLASTQDVQNVAYRIEGEDTYAIQFHPEVHHTSDGAKLLENFLIDIAHILPSWTPDNFVESSINSLKRKLGNDKVVLGLSGGVDSSVAAILLHRSISSRLHCIFVNNGLLRKNEYQNVLAQYQNMGLNVKGVDASARFFDSPRES